MLFNNRIAACTPLTRRTREVMRPELADAWHDADCTLAIRVEQQEGRVVSELEAAAMLVCLRADVMLVATEQCDLHRAPQVIWCHGIVTSGFKSVTIRSVTYFQRHLFEAVDQVHSFGLALVVEEAHSRDVVWLGRQVCQQRRRPARIECT